MPSVAEASCGQQLLNRLGCYHTRDASATPGITVFFRGCADSRALLRHDGYPDRSWRLQQAHPEVDSATGIVAQKLGRYQLDGVAEAAGEVRAVGRENPAGIVEGEELGHVERKFL